MEELKQYQLPTNQKRRQVLEDALFTATALYNRFNQEMDYYEDDGIDACASLDLPEGITVGEERYRRTYSVYIANLGSRFDGLQQIMSALGEEIRALYSIDQEQNDARLSGAQTVQRAVTRAAEETVKQCKGGKEA